MEELPVRSGAVDAGVQPVAERWPALAGLEAPAARLCDDAVRQRWIGWARELGRESNKTPQKAAEAVIDVLGLADLLDVPVRYLSTGQRKRAALARLITRHAPVWLLDEPLNGLDADAVKLVGDLVEDHCNAGGIAVIASHQTFALPVLKQLPLAEFAP